MRVERIKASTMQEAMEIIKKKLGDDAVILNTRSIPDGIEVIAARDAEEQPKTGNSWLDEVIQKDQELRASKSPAAAPAPSINAYNRQGNTDINNLPVGPPLTKPNSIESNIEGLEKLEEATKTAKEFSNMLKDQIQSSQEQHKIWIEHEKQLDTLKKQVIDLKESILRQELIELKKQAKALELSKAEKKSQKQNLKNQQPAKKTAPDPSLKEFYNGICEKLMDRGVFKETAHKIVDNIKKYFLANQFDVNNQSDINLLKNMIVDGISDTITVLPEGAAKIVSVIGPKESGKTTSCLKIALKESLMHNKKVAMVMYSAEPTAPNPTLQQLSAIAKLPLTTISDPAELQKELYNNADKDLVLIDFIDSEPEKLESVLGSLPPSSIVLTLNVNQKYENLKNIQKSFKNVNYHAIMLTHLDRLIKIGLVIEIAQLYQKPLCYIGKGEEIPEDIEYANKTKLSNMILRG